MKLRVKDVMRLEIMLREIYTMVTPWAKANKMQILKNRIIGRVTNCIYPVYCKINEISIKNRKEANVIISLTTYPARINVVYTCLNSILRQTIKPKNVILWLANSQFPQGLQDVPKNILSLQEKGLTIKFCNDLKSYKKIYYTAKEYKNMTIVTADDDTLYPEDWLENLIKEHILYPNCIICYRAHELKIDKNELLPYNEWNKLSEDIKGPSMKLVPIGVGGILYPSNFFEEKMLDSEIFMKLAPTTDDLWLKILAVKKGVETVKVFSNSKEWFTVKSTQQTSLKLLNVEASNGNDTAFEKLMKYYNIDVKDFI